MGSTFDFNLMSKTTEQKWTHFYELESKANPILVSFLKNNFRDGFEVENDEMLDYEVHRLSKKLIRLKTEMKKTS